MSLRMCTGDYLWGANGSLGPDGFRPLRHEFATVDRLLGVDPRHVSRCSLSRHNDRAIVSGLCWNGRITGSASSTIEGVLPERETVPTSF